MKKYASFVPVIGIFLVIYMILKKESADTIWPNIIYYFGSALIQAISISVSLSIFL